MRTPDERPPKAILKFGVLVGGLAVAGALAAWFGPPDPQALKATADQLGAAGPFVAVLSVAAGILFMVPRTVMSIASGLLFGWLPGFLYISLGCLLGAGIGFMAGRLLGRDFVSDKLNKWSSISVDGDFRWRIRALRWFERQLASIDSWLARSGIIGMWIIRMIPVAHYGVTSYASGTAAITFRDFALGTLIGSIPGALGYTAVGGAVLGPGGLSLALGLALGMNLFSVTVIILVRRYVVRRPAED